MKNLIIVLFFFTSGISLFPQQGDSTKLFLSGNLRIDSRITANNMDVIPKPVLIESENKKSPFLAGAMSAVIPGAGEVYAGSYWKAAIFVAIEAAAIYANIIYNKKGDDATLEFQKFADEHWNASRYADWLTKYSAELGITTTINLTKVEQHEFSTLNAAESQVKVTDANGKQLAFSHVLPSYHSQQYYELIGKYHQFNHGWDDSDPNSSEWINNLSPRFDQYAAMHIKPDDTFYKYASITIVAIVINHLISVADAVWTTSRYNKNLTANLEIKKMENQFAVEYYPQLNVKFTL
ncbi:MAG: hypothetical protein NTX22_06395 [Ignavibacteriales bacterium]|nr:hypothetical protein [Ignavibacteriales bacterium]